MLLVTGIRSSWSVLSLLTSFLCRFQDWNWGSFRRAKALASPPGSDYESDADSEDDPRRDNSPSTSTTITRRKRSANNGNNGSASSSTASSTATEVGGGAPKRRRS